MKLLLVTAIGLPLILMAHPSTGQAQVKGDCSRVSLSEINLPAHEFMVANAMIPDGIEFNFDFGRGVLEPVKIQVHEGHVLVGIQLVEYTKEDPNSDKETKSLSPGVEVIVLETCQNGFHFAKFEDVFTRPKKIVAKLSDPTNPNVGYVWAKFIGEAGYPVLKSWYAQLQNNAAFHGIVLPLKANEKLPAYDLAGRKWKVVDAELALMTTNTPEAKARAESSNVFPWEFDMDLRGSLKGMPSEKSKSTGEGRGAVGGNFWPVGFIIEQVLSVE